MDRDRTPIVDERFADLRLNTWSACSCTPRPPPGEVGLWLAAPPILGLAFDVRTGAAATHPVVPIAGTYRLDPEHVAAGGLGSGIRLVIRAVASGKEYWGYLGDAHGTVAVEEPAAPPPLAECSGVGGAFTANLIDHVAWPLSAGCYEIHAEAAGMRSDAVPIEIVDDR